ncbi:unnamed protein product, partial [Iphiclides podalirius]
MSAESAAHPKPRSLRLAPRSFRSLSTEGAPCVCRVLSLTSGCTELSSSGIISLEKHLPPRSPGYFNEN